GPALRVRLAVLDGRARLRQCLNDNRNDGVDNNADEQPTADLADHEPATDQQTKDEDEGGPSSDRAVDPQADWDGRTSGVRDAANETGVHQADHGAEQADTHADRGLQAGRNRVEDRLAEASDGQENDDDAVDDHQAHGLWPGQSLGSDEGHRDQGVNAQAGGDAERVLGDDTKSNGHHASGEGRHRGDAGGSQDVAVDVRSRTQDQWVQDDDVGHREERDHATADLVGDGGATLRDVEEAIQPAAGWLFRWSRIW